MKTTVKYFKFFFFSYAGSRKPTLLDKGIEIVKTALLSPIGLIMQERIKEATDDRASMVAIATKRL